MTAINIPNSVNTIEQFAFRGSGLIEVTIPNSVTQIYSQAFQACTSLKRATLPEGLTNISAGLFYQCSSLESIVIPEGVTDIFMYAFYDCTSLANINIPNATLYIDTDAFTNTPWLNNQPNGVVYAGKVAYTYKGTMPEGTYLTLKSDTRSIGTAAFRYQSSLVGITIPASVVYIGNQCISVCVNLSTIKVESGNTVYDSRENCNAIIETATNTLVAGCNNTVIPNSVTAIGKFAFIDCISLTDAQLHEQITTIGEQAYLGCEGLTQLRIPASVTNIENAAFAACNGVTKISVDSRNTVYDSRNSCNAIIQTSSNKLISGCQNTIIPNDVTVIDDFAFYMIYHLTHITIPASVNSIGKSAFQYADELKTVISESTTPPTITASTFYYTTYEQGTLYVPRASIDAYRNANYWNYFIDIRAIEDLIAGDINDDGELSISDVALLIDYLLTNNQYGINIYNADTDKNGSVDISDVSKLIDFLLTQ